MGRIFFYLSWGIAEQRRYMRLMEAEDCGWLRDGEKYVCDG